MIRKLQLMWFGITHVIEITDYISERLDRVEWHADHIGFQLEYPSGKPFTSYPSNYPTGKVL